MNPATRMMIRALTDLAQSRSSMADAAKAVDADYAYVRAMTVRHDLPFPKRPRGRPPGLTKGPDARCEDMRRRYLEGETLNQIGEFWLVSRERVRQLLTKHYGIRAIDGGQSVTARQKRRALMIEREKRLQQRWGCNYAQYQAILKRPDRPTWAYSCQRKNAQNRGIGWEITLWQWWQLWQASGHWSERGRGRGYQMCRLNDVGPYSVDNVYIATGVENIQDHWVNRKAAQVAA